MTEIKRFIQNTIKEANMDPKFVTIGDHESLRTAGMDSLDSATLLLAIEEEFNISISDSDFEKLDCINDFVEYIKENSDQN